MHEELDWLREVAPPPGDPDQLTLRRARNRLLAELREPTAGTGDSHLLLALEALDEQGQSDRSDVAGTGHRGRVAVLGSVAAAILVLVGAVWLTTGRGPDELDHDEIAATGATVVPPDAAATPAPDGRAPSSVGPDLAAVPVDLSRETDLADGQLVAVSAEGIEVGAVWVAQCVDSAAVAARGLDGCDLGTVQIGSAGEDGSIAVEFRVHRHIEVDGTAVDCSTTSCAVALTQLDDSRRAGTVRIEFDPSAPSSAGPTLDVEPATDLVDGQVLEVRGQGFGPGVELRILQCVIGVAETEPNCLTSDTSNLVSTVDGGELVTDAGGGFRLSVFVSRIPASQRGEIDCATLEVGQCVVALVDPAGRGLLAVQLLRFDPAVAPPEPGVSVEPRSGLAEGVPVTISVTSFRGLDDAELRLCSAQTAGRCAAVPLPSTAQQGSSLAFELSLPRLFDADDGYSHDCVRDGPCELRLDVAGLPHASQPLDYDPDAPLVDSIDVPVDPAGPYRPGDRVSLDLPAGRAVHIAQCVVDAPAGLSLWDFCDIYTRLEIDQPTGRGVPGASEPPVATRADDGPGVALAVFRLIVLPGGRSHDCVSDGPCELVIRSGAELRRFDPIPLVFDPDVAPLHDPELSVTKAADLQDREEVTITVTGLTSTADFQIQICPEGTPTEVRCPVVAHHRLGDDDQVAVSVPRETFDTITGRVHDCAEGCSLRVTNTRVSAEVAVRFDPGADLAPPPRLEVEPAEPEPATSVIVTGQGFKNETSDPQLETYICPSRPGDWTTIDLAERCLAPPESSWSDAGPVVDDNGMFVSTFAMPGEIPGPEGDIAHDCDEQPCWLVVATAAHVAGPQIAAVQLP